MKYIVRWTIPRTSVIAAERRFLETGGMPPAGVKLLGRWHGMSGGGLAIAETNDAKALYTWVAQWTDLLQLETTPCLDDAEGAAVLKALKR